MSSTIEYLWTGTELADVSAAASIWNDASTPCLAADSWLVTEGRSLALELHRSRFLEAVEAHGGVDDELAPGEFWNSALALIPRSRDWFPRVELRLRDGNRMLRFLLRPAPARTASARLVTLPSTDPRTEPLFKGPATGALFAVREHARDRGADETVIVSPEGYVVEGAASALLWWRGSFICAPSHDLERVSSVTSRSVLTLAAALKIDVHYESVTPAELDGLEIWTLSSLHGIRIVTEWIDGPNTAELPARLSAWRARLDRLRQPI